MPSKHMPQAIVSDTSLRGISVVITRPAEVAAQLCDEIERRGGKAIVFPALEITGLPPDAQLAAELDAAQGYDYWIFVSQHAVEHGVRLLRERGITFAGITAIAMGPTTQRALTEAGFERVLVRTTGFDSEALLALPELQATRAGKVLIFRGRGGRETLREGLQARGWQVRYIECYERREPVQNSTALLAAWGAGKVHAVSAMSVQTLENFMTAIGAEGNARLRDTTLFVPHERIAVAARAHGLSRIVVTGIGDAALLDALAKQESAVDDRQR